MRYVIPLILIIAFTNCRHEKPGEKVKRESEQQTQKQTVTQEKSKMVYRVPTPIEFFMFYKSAGGKYNEENLLSPQDVDRYLSTKEKAIAFGIYASDLAYNAVFAQNQKTIKYFETGKKLADELGFTEGYGEKLMQRFHNNLDNVDSLYNLTADSYWNVFNFLEDQDKTRLLSYITVAGWLESLYLSYNAIKEYQKGEILNCLADQQYVLENLNAFLKKVHPDDYSKDEVFGMVMELNKKYQVLYENPDNSVMTSIQFDSIKATVNRNRTMLVK